MKSAIDSVVTAVSEQATLGEPVSPSWHVPAESLLAAVGVVGRQTTRQRGQVKKRRGLSTKQYPRLWEAGENPQR